MQIVSESLLWSRTDGREEIVTTSEVKETLQTTGQQMTDGKTYNLKKKILSAIIWLLLVIKLTQWQQISNRLWRETKHDDTESPQKIDRGKKQPVECQ